MAMNLDAVLRIAAKVVGMKDVTELQAAIGRVDKAASDMKTSFKGVLNSAAWQGAAVGAAGIVAGLAMSTRAAIQFESAMADVRKVVNGVDTPEGMRAIRGEIFQLSRELPISQQGFAEMYAAAAQSGIARNELQQFSRDVAAVAVAFDMTAGEAGTAMAKIRTNLGISQKELMNLSDAMNHLSNNMASTGAQLVDFMRRSASQGKQAGLTAEQTAALGSAMIAAGAEAEVASTSFNNMVKALSRGDSMTERQVSALVKLGYATAGAAERQKELTEAARVQSEERMRMLERESSRVINEIERRYRRLAQIQDDTADDEMRKWSRSQEDRYEVQARALERRQQAETEAAQQAAGIQQGANPAILAAIEDRYDAMRKQLQRQQEDERIAYQRAQRDRQQELRDSLAERQRIETEAAEARFREMKKIEELRAKEAQAAAEAAAKAITAELGPKLAQRLQTDAVGTIRDVFTRIQSLPKDMRLSVISDLFGDEARALAPLIANTKLFEQALALVAGKQEYAGSTARELASRMSTAANDIQMAQNRMNELQITIGEKLVPVLTRLLDVLTPIVDLFGKIAGIPVVGELVIGFLALASAATLLAPGIAAVVKGLQAIAAFKGLQAIAAFFTGAAAIAAAKVILIGALIVGIGVLLYKLVEAIWNSREQIGNFLQAIVKEIGRFFTWFGNLITKDIPKKWNELITAANKFGADLGLKLRQAFLGAVENVKTAAMNIWNGMVNAMRNALNGVLRGFGGMVNFVIRSVNNLIVGFNRLPARIGLPGIPTIPEYQPPQFADGGYVTRPTLGMIGEAGEPEYIIPASRMGAAASAYQAGARGAAVLSSQRSGQPVINIQTGPVLRQDGQDWVSVADLERAMRATADAVLSRTRTPAGRLLLGLS